MRLVALVAVAVPIVVAVAWAVRFGWAGSGDDGILVLRSWDVLHGHPPVRGMPSTLHGPPGVRIHHPGPLPFYLLAPFSSLTPRAWGTVIGVGVVHLVSCWATLRSARRLGAEAFASPGPVTDEVAEGGDDGDGRVGARAADPGRRPMVRGDALVALMAVGLVVLELGLGSQILYRPFNPYLSLFAYPALLLAVAEVIGGRPRSLVGVAFFGAFVGQAHLSGLPPFAALTLLAGLGLIAWVHTTRTWPWRPMTVAAAVAAVCWAPTVIQQVTGQPGNLWAIYQGLFKVHRTTSGTGGGLRLAASTVGLPPPLGLWHGRTGMEIGISGWMGSPVWALLPGLIGGGLLLVHLVSRRPRLDDHRRLTGMLLTVLTAWLVALAMCLNANNQISYQVVALRPLAMTIWFVLAWTAFRTMVRLRGSRAPRSLRPAVALTVVAVLLAVAFSRTPYGQEGEERQTSLATSRDLYRSVQDADLPSPVTVRVFSGGWAAFTGLPLVASAVQHEGITTYVAQSDPLQLQFYGEFRAPPEDPATLVQVWSGKGAPDVPEGADLLFQGPTGNRGTTVAVWVERRHR